MFKSAKSNISACMFLLRSFKLLPKAVSVRSIVELENKPLKSSEPVPVAIERSKLCKLSVTFCTSKSPEFISAIQV